MTANQRRRLKLHTSHDYVSEKISNTPNVRSKGISFEPPNNTFFVIPRILRPVIKLKKANGEVISAETRVFLGKQRPGDDIPYYLPGVFPLYDFNDLTTAEQRNRENAASLTQDIGQGIVLREGETLFAEFEGPDAIDWTKAGTAFELDVEWSGI